MDCERSPVGGERTGANPTFRGMEPPMEWVGPPMTEPVEAWTVAAVEPDSDVTLATQQDGVKYAELALGLPLVSYIAPPALPSLSNSSPESYDSCSVDALKAPGADAEPG